MISAWSAHDQRAMTARRARPARPLPSSTAPVRAKSPNPDASFQPCRRNPPTSPRSTARVARRVSAAPPRRRTSFVKSLTTCYDNCPRWPTS